MAMVAFSATLIVHINCFVNSCRVVQRGGRYPWLRWWNMFQATCAVSCHLCRISDYFFPTDCNFKGYYNFVSYNTAILSMDGMVAFMAAMILLTTIVYREKAIILCCFGAMMAFLTKLHVIVRAFLSVSNSVGPFSLCLTAFSVPSLFVEAVFSEVGCHVFTLLTNGAIFARYMNQNPSVLTRDKMFTLNFNDHGLLYMMFMDLVTIVLYTPVGLGSGGPNPEVLIQVRWAITSKCFNIALIRFLNCHPPEPRALPLKSSIDTQETSFPAPRSA
ncbi:hypothetical protein DSO57_1019051 [Entomophthora muscae]|uniref:Uncharacterized protein n=1 Tax=Entomophthora muscae TaxID=34485 RepID=A0ACC2T447_9FUNG|nr:hypothetical protein DSO57_1019051 [Entomophthora muscae]